MNNEQQNTVWSAWINEAKKIVTIKESPNAKQVFFKNRAIGMEAIMKFVSKGYKIDITIAKCSNFMVL